MSRVAFYNALGGIMWVTEDKVNEYKALGYQPVPTESTEPKQAEKPKEQAKAEKPKPKATTTKKTVSKSKK